MRVRARSGFALLLVLWVLVVLGAVGSALALSTRSAGAAAVNARARTVGRYAAESGVSAAVSLIEQALARHTTEEERNAWLNGLGGAPLPRTVLGDARFEVAFVDPGTRLDVNAADAASLARLFAYFTDPIEAERAAAAIRAHIAGPADPLGGLRAVRPLRSLDALDGIPEVRRGLAERAVPYLTVDGDGAINRAMASDTVRAVATGELRDAPSRLVIVSRGWLVGQPLTHEIQAVYAVVGNALTLVRWRERDL